MINLNTNLGLLLQDVTFATGEEKKEKINIVSDSEIANVTLVRDTIEQARQKIFPYFKDNRKDFTKKASDLQALISEEIEILNNAIDSRKIIVKFEGGNYLRAYYTGIKIDGKMVKVCQMSTFNKKLLPNTTEGFLIWSILGKLTCNGKTKLCAEKCYNNCRYDGNNINFKIINLIFSFLNKDLFVDTLEKIIEKSPHQKTFVRIHEDGDFYEKEYFEKWVALSKKINVNFTAYTKEPTLLNRVNEINSEMPNFYIRFSVMEDTNPNIIKVITENNIPTFGCLGKNKGDEKIISFVDGLSFQYKCEGSCQHCKKCYVKGHNKILVAMH